MYLKLSNITKYFGTKPAVENISFSIPQGSFVTLLGPSGCGKSTLLKMISGLFIPEVGTIHLDGEDITTKKIQSRDIGLVFQSYALFPHLTVFENVAFGLKTKKLKKR
ncbi:MAG: ATP-binding cassette domain-containing protein, partial [Bacilli bacterium]